MINTKQLYISKSIANESQARIMFNSDDYTNCGDYKLVYMEEILDGYVGLMVQTSQGKFKETLEKIKNNEDVDLIDQGFIRIIEFNTSEKNFIDIRKIAKELTPNGYKILGLELKNYTNKDPNTGEDCFDYLAMYEAI